MTSLLEDLIAGLAGGEMKHHGVLGMKWGVRKAGTGQPSSHHASPDHAAATAALAKIKSGGGTRALSNNELQTLVARMNLESQYSSLSSRGSTKSVGKRFMSSVSKDLVDVARTQAKGTVNMLLKNQIKNALKTHGLV